jgi:ABC-type lipoprotein release transport system permease subunit
MIAGRLPASPDSRDLVVGEKMAEKLKIKIGKKLVYTLTDVHGEIVSEVGRVAGIFRTGVEEVDGAVCLIPIGRARSVVKYGPGEASLVAVFIRDQRKVNRVRDALALAAGGPGVEILTWQKTQADVNGLIEVDRKSNRISQLFVGLLIAAGVLNTLFMSVLERKREFGIMMAVGLAPGRLFGLVILESLYIAVVGLALGALITAPVFYYLYHYGLDLRYFIEEGYAIGSVLVDPVLKVRLFKESAAMILGGVFCLTILAGLYPAWKAGRENPVDSIKTI